jgi:Uma2 family endonuclease
VATTPTRVMTFAAFEQLPNPKEGRYELAHGELVSVPPPKWKHFAIQSRLRRLLESASERLAYAVELEFAFRAVPDDYRIADLALVSKQRWESVDPDGYFCGAPELVVEVLSPVNTATELLDKETLCLENGCREFWVVDIDRRQVKVSTPDGHTVAYRSGQEIPLFFTSGAKLAVDTIFQ